MMAVKEGAMTTYYKGLDKDFRCRGMQYTLYRAQGLKLVKVE
jgi:hypothetical protein